MQFLTTFIPKRFIPQIKTYLYEKTLSGFSSVPLPDSEVQVRTLLCHSHVHFFHYSIRTFFKAVGHILPILIVDDGSLTVEDKKLLVSSFNTQIITRKEVIKLAAPILKKAPYLKKYVTDPKLTVKNIRALLALLPNRRAILYEADILFFEKSRVIQDWIEKRQPYRVCIVLDEFSLGWLKETHAVDHPFRRLLNKNLSAHSNVLFNAGLTLMTEVTQNDLQLIEKACQLYFEIGYTQNHLSDEVLASYLIDERRDKALSPKLYKSVWSRQHYDAMVTKNVRMVHYAGEAKTVFEEDAVKFLGSPLSKWLMKQLTSESDKTG